MKYTKPAVKTARVVEIQSFTTHMGRDGKRYVNPGKIRVYHSAQQAAKSWAQMMADKWRWSFHDDKDLMSPIPDWKVTELRQSKYYRRALPVFERIFEGFK